MTSLISLFKELLENRSEITIFFQVRSISVKVRLKIGPEIILWACVYQAERCTSRKHLSVEILLHSAKVLSFLVLI